VNSPQIFSTYFQRAIGYERLGKIDKALKDYSACIAIDNNSALAYFNRSGLYSYLGKQSEALADLNSAITIDPTNATYRSNRALLERRRGDFDGAINDTIMSRAIELNPSLVTSDSVDDMSFDADVLLANSVADDPIKHCLKYPKGDRPRDECFEQVVKFISSLKMFRGVAPDETGLENIAQYVEMMQVEAGHIIFEEGDPCDLFYIIFEGVVSITRKFRGMQRGASNVLVNLAYGHSFGDANLEKPGGCRTAGATALKKCILLTLTAADYSMVMSGYRQALQNEVKHVIATCPVFKTWDSNCITKLAESAARRSYNAGSTIMSVGDPARTLFMVIRGVVKLIKPIPRPNVRDINVGENYLPSSATGLGSESPGLWVRELNWRDRLDIDEKVMMNLDGSKKQVAECTVGVVCVFCRFSSSCNVLYDAARFRTDFWRTIRP
jgi:CRP-like cAMP-binding protein